MASKLYKWTGSIKQPTSFAGDPPMWFGTDGEGVSYAWLTTTFASACESENDDLGLLLQVMQKHGLNKTQYKH